MALSFPNPYQVFFVPKTNDIMFTVLSEDVIERNVT